MDCPVCGNLMTHQSWSDDIAGAPTTVETLTKCPQGCYESHYSYGAFLVRIGRQEWHWRYDSLKDQVAWIEREIKTAMERALSLRPV